jgi:hypothetical protein
VTFVGRAGDDMGEVYAVNIVTRDLRQVSFQKDSIMGVMTYDYSPSSGAARATVTRLALYYFSARKGF